MEEYPHEWKCKAGDTADVTRMDGTEMKTENVSCFIHQTYNYTPGDTTKLPSSKFCTRITCTPMA